MTAYEVGSHADKNGYTESRATVRMDDLVDNDVEGRLDMFAQFDAGNPHVDSVAATYLADQIESMHREGENLARHHSKPQKVVGLTRERVLEAHR